MCDNEGWVCENHMTKPWDGTSSRKDACGCGAGAPCPYCNKEDPPRMSGTIIFDREHGWRH